ncbi:hypothetical protein MASR1M45_23550 [Candidatus Kapaibacterium sp.]
MEIKDLIHFLPNVEIFAELNNDELKSIANICKIHNYKTDEYLFEENNSRKSLFILQARRIYKKDTFLKWKSIENI